MEPDIVQLSVTIIAGTIEHSNVDLGVSSRFYVVLVVDGAEIKSTSTLERTSDPCWKETFDVTIRSGSILSLVMRREKIETVWRRPISTSGSFTFPLNGIVDDTTSFDGKSKESCGCYLPTEC